MKKMSQTQMKFMAEALRNVVREALSEEVNALFAARIAALDDMAEETRQEEPETTKEAENSGEPENSPLSTVNSPLSTVHSQLQSCIAGAGLPEEDAALLEPLASDVSAMIEHGRWADLLPLLTRAARYDKDVARAAEEGEVRGRNAAVEIALKRLNRSDGIPVAPSASIPATDFKPVSIFSIARQAKDS